MINTYLDNDEGDIILVMGVLLKPAGLLDAKLQYLPGRPAGIFPDDAVKIILAEFLARRIPGFPDPVGIEGDDLAPGQG